MNRFFFDPDDMEGGEIRIGGGDVNHIKNVLRLKRGDGIICCDGRMNDYYCRIEAFEKDGVVARIEKKERCTGEPPARLYLFQALPKLDKMELIIQKAVELGAYKIIPMVTSRCVAALPEGERRERKLARWRLISESAAKQCGRGMIPEVRSPMAFADAIEYAKQLDYNLFPYENAKGMDHSRKCMEEASKKGSVGIFIGPEGGYGDDEADMARDAGYNVISLGSRILRTETAGMAALSVLTFLMPDSGRI